MECFRRGVRASAMAGGFALCAGASAAMTDADYRLRHMIAPAIVDLAGSRRDMPATARSLLGASLWGTVRNAPQAHLDRVAALIGDNVQLGHGPRIELASDGGQVRPRHARRILALSSTQRPLRDDLAPTKPGIGASGIQDRRPEMPMRLAF